MNKYQWMKRNRNSNNFYKMIVLFILFVVVSFVLLRGCQSIAKDIWHNAADKTADKLGMLAFDALAVHEIYDDFDDGEENLVAELVMNQIFPVGELYMQNYVEPIGGGSEPDYEIADNESKREEQTENGMTTPVTEPDGTTQTETSEDAAVTTEGQTSIPAPETTLPQNTDSPVRDSRIMEAAAKIYPADKLLDYDYVLNNFFVVPSVTTLRRSVLDLPKIASINVTMEKNPEVPQILIFHTHSQETFSDYETNPKSIVDVGNYLTELLRDKYGYNVIHLTDEFDMLDGKLDRGKAYTYANAKIEQVLAENPSIQVVIDLHRDGVREDLHLVTDINGKQTAKIMLFNGISYTNEVGEIDYLANPYLTENLTMTYKMYLLGKAAYPDFIRCIYVSGYRYCLYHRARSMLIEAGAQTNTFEEVYNAMEPLADLINKELTVN